MKKIISIILIIIIFILTVTFQDTEKELKNFDLYLMNAQTPRGYDILINIKINYIDENGRFLDNVLNKTIDFYNEYKNPNSFSVEKKEKLCEIEINIYNKTQPNNIVISEKYTYDEIRDEYYFNFWYSSGKPVLENWTGGIA